MESCRESPPRRWTTAAAVSVLQRTQLQRHHLGLHDLGIADQDELQQLRLQEALGGGLHRGGIRLLDVRRRPGDVVEREVLGEEARRRPREVGHGGEAAGHGAQEALPRLRELLRR